MPSQSNLPTANKIARSNPLEIENSLLPQISDFTNKLDVLSAYLAAQRRLEYFSSLMRNRETMYSASLKPLMKKWFFIDKPFNQQDFLHEVRM